MRIRMSAKHGLLAALVGAIVVFAAPSMASAASANDRSAALALIERQHLLNSRSGSAAQN